GSAIERQLLLRAALAGQLPTVGAHASVLPPRHAWAALFAETVTPERLAAQGFFRPEAVARLRDEHLAGRREHSAALWAIVVATRRGRPSGWRSSTRHSVTGPDQLGYASKSVRTAKQSSTDPITSAEYDCAKSATARGRYRALAGDVKIRVTLPWRERFRYA